MTIHRRRRAFPILIAALLAAGCGAPSGGSPAASSAPTSLASSVLGASPAVFGDPRPVIIDTDMAADDWLAILYLLGRPEVDVVAVTVTGTGEAHCEPGVHNALALVALAGHPDVPVACGRETPLAGTNAFPDDWRDGVDSLFGIGIPDGSAAADSGSAVELLERTLRDAPDKVALLTLGPLTNVAEMLDKSPGLADKIEATFIMGGAVDVDGNVGDSGVGIDNRVAEWNIYVDPLAAKAVLDAGIRVTLVPLDATNHAPATIAFTARLKDDATTASAKFANDVLTQLSGAIASGFYYFWDPFAAAVLVDESLTSFETGGLSVEVKEGPESGGVIDAPDGQQTRFATSADLARFEQLFIDTLNGRAR